MNFIESTFQGVIVCRDYKRTWAFPREVSELLERETAGRTVLQLYSTGHTLRSVATRFNLGFVTVWAIVKRKTWKHV